MNERLGIAITTFNRGDVLRDVLAVMVPLAAAHEIPIYVNDNGSTDGTAAVLAGFAAQYRYFFPHIQASNLGFDANFAHCVQRCETAYIWGMADYSFLAPDALARLLALTQDDRFDLITLNNSNRVTGPTQETYADVPALVRDIAWHITLLDTIVWRRAVVQTTNFSRYFGSLFGYYGGMFEFLGTHPFLVKWEKESFVTGIHPAKQSLWYPRALDTWCGKWSNLILSLPFSIPLREKNRLIRSHSLHSGLFSVKSMLSLRAEKYLSIAILRKDLHSIAIALSARQLATAFAIALVPAGPLKHIKRVIFKK